MRYLFSICFVLCLAIGLEARPVYKINTTSGPNSSFVEVEFKVDSFIDINAIQFSLNWNSSILEFNELVSTGSALPAGSLTADNINASIPGFPGTAVFSWNTSGPFVTLANGSVFFKVKFKIIGTVGQSSVVNLSNTPLNFEYTSASGTFSSIGSVAGSVTVTGGGGGNNIRFIGSSETAAAGANVCVKISAEGFSNISSFQYAIQFNPSVLEFVQVNGINLTGLSSSNFNANNTTGFINVVWSNADPATVANGVTIYELCFKVKAGATGESPISFGPNPPLTVEVTGAATSYNFLSTSGLVTVSGGNTQCIPTGLGIGITNDTIPPGGKAVVSFKAYGFTNIEGYQMTIRYDITKLRFDSIRSVFFPGANIDNDFNVANAAQGRILHLYSSGTPITRPNGSDMFIIAFTVIGPLNSCADISIGLEPTEQLVLDFTPGGSNVQVCKGKICIGNKNVVTPTDCTISATASMTRQTTCPGSSNGAATINESTSGNCNLPLSYRWDNGETTKTANALSAGTHTVTVSDSSTPAKTITAMVVVTAISASEPTISPAITNVLCSGQSSGSIQLTVTPSTGISYQWSNGTTGSSISNIPAGNYSVIITYPGGCTLTRNYQITTNQPINITNKTTNPTQLGQSTGTISFTPTGGTGQYTYNWNPGGVTTTPARTALSAGTYTVTVTDTNGCFATDVFTITSTGGGNPIVITTTTSNNNGYNIKCATTCDGSIIVQATGGSGNFTYNWADGSTISTRANLCKGTYRVTVSDSQGAKSTAEIVLTAPDALVASEINKICTDTTMNVCIMTLGGVKPYTYAWTNQSTLDSCLNNVSPKTYQVVVRDANNCAVTVITECTKGPDPQECLHSKVITPNDDGKNDIFKLSCVDNQKNTLEIFDRWGKLVYNVNNYNNDWKGISNNNEDLPTGGYYFVFSIKNNLGATLSLVKGAVTILRN